MPNLDIRTKARVNFSFIWSRWQGIYNYKAEQLH